MKLKKTLVYMAMLMIGLGFVACAGDEASSTDTDILAGEGVPVEVLVIKPENVQKNISFSGILQPVHSVDIMAEVSGKIIKINKKLGEIVTTSDVLAEIDDEIPLSNYRQGKSTVLSAENNLKIAELNLKSDEDLFASGDISKLAYENALLGVKTAEANHLLALANLSRMEKAYKDTRIKSPISGYVSRKYVDIGTMVNPNMSVYRVVDLSALKINIGVPQEMIPVIRPGSEARVYVSAYSGELLSGKVRYVSPQADERTGSFNVEVHVTNRGPELIPAGMTARIEIVLDKQEGIIALPNYAIVQQDNQFHIYKVEKNHAVLTPVEVGEGFENRRIVINGLVMGDTVITVGMKNLSGDDVVVIERYE
ncbi:MAG: efflux RND transporter periplasmic adaptor subunit [Calditrichales bacterium]|nr:MAG: efflux RND transporter periplasmic adaptor subunit [Calditrichales bacterium]